MRTTVELDPHTHQRLKTLAKEMNQSLSETIGQLATYGLNKYAPDESRIKIDPLTGFPTFDTGRPVTSEEVADMIDEDL
ncbi:MAG: toxin-antitoxin system, antitoxin component [Actinomycetaceae bacterium]|nr:toxin-antitoxin system, antitoxin component [Actinomycetaceae bacterium]